MLALKLHRVRYMPQVTPRLAACDASAGIKTADGMLLAQGFVMRDRDLVYVADSPSVQLGKLARLFDVVSSIFKSGSSTSLAF